MNLIYSLKLECKRIHYIHIICIKVFCHSFKLFLSSKVKKSLHCYWYFSANSNSRWANQCNYGSDTERDVSRFSVGQNVYEASDVDEGPIDLKRAIDDWYNEVEEVNSDFVEEF